MKLPGAERCIVERQKIVDYLLNAAHPDNGGKAQFFAALGFGIRNWQMLANAMRQLAVSAEVSMSVESVHGQKFIVDGFLQGTTGQIRGIRTV